MTGVRGLAAAFKLMDDKRTYELMQHKEVAPIPNANDATLLFDAWCAKESFITAAA
jgi:phosphopantetheinyl transferase